MKILVTGAKGQLGRELERILSNGEAEIGPIPESYRDAEVVYAGSEDLDVTDERECRNLIAAGSFDLVINCAAMTDVDGCETSQFEAYLINATGPGNLARAAQAYGAKIVHVSTDYVFPGTEERPRVETDETGPASAYGKSKLAGEQEVLRACDRSFVVRTAWLYGYVGRNFVKTMVRLGSSRDAVTVVSDQMGNPTSANDLAYAILQIAEGEDYGVYHCTNEGTCSWADFAQEIMERAGLDCRVERCTSEEYRQMNPASASRPAFSSLENARLEAAGANCMRPWQQALETYFQNLEALGD